MEKETEFKVRGRDDVTLVKQGNVYKICRSKPIKRWKVNLKTALLILGGCLPLGLLMWYFWGCYEDAMQSFDIPEQLNNLPNGWVYFFTYLAIEIVLSCLLVTYIRACSIWRADILSKCKGAEKTSCMR